MKKLILVFCLLFTACASTQQVSELGRLPAADDKGTGRIGSSESDVEVQSSFSVYKLPITRNKITSKRLATSGWAGEWPGPIIDINASDAQGKTVIEGYDNLRKPEKRVSCTVQNGVYHPWSMTTNSVEDYWSLDEVADYKVIRDIKLNYNSPDNNRVFEGLKVPKKGLVIKRGTKIINEYYNSEGYCSATLVLGKAKQEVYYYCDALSGDKKNFEEIKVPGAIYSKTPEDRFREQWLAVLCKGSNEPKRVFIEDKDLLNQPGVKYGKMCGYGHSSYETDPKCSDE